MGSLYSLYYEKDTENNVAGTDYGINNVDSVNDRELYYSRHIVYFGNRCRSSDFIS